MYIVHEHKNVIALDKVDCKLSCRGMTDEIDEKCHTGQSDKGVKGASYFALKSSKTFLFFKRPKVTRKVPVSSCGLF